jgi:alpha-L-glutamate ligase-like protein
VKLLSALRREGVLGINRRNHEFTLRWNPRRLYPTVDDKLATKKLCQAAGIPIPGLIAVARRQVEVREMIGQLADLSQFVLKPAHGAMGNGILVVRAREGDAWRRAGGKRLTPEDLRYHAASIISGLYALGGQPDVAFVEELLEVHPQLAEISSDGVPDVRVIVHRGIPIMSMTRLPTHRSRGRANLHQGAIGAGVDLATGRILHAVLDGAPITRHPDNDRPVLGVVVPSFPRVLEIAVAATDQTGLGYVGADVVVDARKGPVVLELNARPGLAIQAANRAGLLPRLRAVSERIRPEATLAERIALGIEISRTARSMEPA